ncbi:hypothetical protein P154DRAFT_535545 [Amniculicola lignicola CBS 123094]|uniref:Cyanovirin-N domain-containing protein n=1 Tax=Amniculicola lignicola CBS 123094 TaxID=1392246 RepID=A0A6A5WF65_9PLEO|nr:hypothetical protein P154DRAFT_535545 [Amniculicola lignicola CBS 123094]
MKNSILFSSFALLLSTSHAFPILHGPSSSMASVPTSLISRAADSPFLEDAFLEDPRTTCKSGRGRPNPFEKDRPVFVKSVREPADENSSYEEGLVSIGEKQWFEYGQYLNVDCNTACFVLRDGYVAVCDIFDHEDKVVGTCVSMEQNGLPELWRGADETHKILSNGIECRIERAAVAKKE